MNELEKIEEMAFRLLVANPDKHHVGIDIGFKRYFNFEPMNKKYCAFCGNDFEYSYFDNLAELEAWVDERTRKGKEILFRKFK